MKFNLVLILILLFFSASSQVTLTSSNLPLIVINTHGQAIMDDPKIVAEMGIINNGPGQRNNITDAFNEYNGKIGIEFHGQSSLMFPMKSMGIELRKEDGETSQDKALFGLPAQSDWILYAPYTDKTLMRNFIAYTTAREMGRWAANCRYVEMVINGEYQGIYILEEQIRRDKGRVNISKLKPTDVDGDDVTGGYILRIDKDPVGWKSSYKTKGSNAEILFNYYYPKAADIVQQQKDYIAAYVDSFETALAKKPFNDTINGYTHFADMGSFIDYFITSEFTHNVDAYRISTYFYKDKQSKGGKINAGPVWDYDLAFRNAEYCDGSRNDTWAYNFNTVCKDYWYVPFWWSTLLTDTNYTAALRCRWNTLRKTTFSEAHLNAMIDSIYQLTAEARTRHFAQWNILGSYVWPNPKPIPANYDEEVYSLKNWIHNRLEWLDAKLPQNGPCGEYIYPARPSFIVDINPNPFYGNAVLQLQGLYAQDVEIRVVNSAGVIMYSGQYRVTGGGINTLTLPTTAWASGMYYFNFVSKKSGDHLLKRMLKSTGH